MKKYLLGLIILLNINLEAVENDSSTVSGYFRSTYHVHDLKNDKTYRDDGIGGKLHFKTASYEGLSLGAS
ncbi:MAG: Unknown protein, partial [uncultured Sulfurovum sp.]